VVEAVGRLGAVQSQDYPGSAWGLAQRVGATTLADVTALYDAGGILRAHAMRPTWHFVRPDDIRRLQALTGPRVRAQNAGIERRLELDDDTWGRCRTALRSALCGGAQRTRAELSAALADAGIEARGQRLAYIVMRAELDGLIASGAFRGKQFTYALLEDRAPSLPEPFDRDAARAELVRRYFTSHGPALVRDFVWWSGLVTADARAGIASLGDELVREMIDGKEYWSAASAPTEVEVEVPPGTVHLLPNYDEYLGSYADYEPIFDAALPRARTIADILGVHIVVRDGLVVGGWKRKIEADRAVIDMTILLPLTARDERGLERAIDDFGRFLGLPVDLRITMASGT
jgi:winged helix DNA-binding protein